MGAAAEAEGAVRMVVLREVMYDRHAHESPANNATKGRDDKQAQRLKRQVTGVRSESVHGCGCGVRQQPNSNANEGNMQIKQVAESPNLVVHHVVFVNTLEKRTKVRVLRSASLGPAGPADHTSLLLALRLRSASSHASYTAPPRS